MALQLFKLKLSMDDGRSNIRYLTFDSTARSPTPLAWATKRCRLNTYPQYYSVTHPNPRTPTHPS